MAHLVKHVTLDLKIMSLNPMLGVEITLLIIIKSQD